MKSPFPWFSKPFWAAIVAIGLVVGLVDSSFRPNESNIGPIVVAFCFLFFLALMLPFLDERIARLYLKPNATLDHARANLSFLAVISFIMGLAGLIELSKANCSWEIRCLLGLS